MSYDSAFGPICVDPQSMYLLSSTLPNVRRALSPSFAMTWPLASRLVTGMPSESNIAGMMLQTRAIGARIAVERPASLEVIWSDPAPPAPPITRTVSVLGRDDTTPDDAQAATAATDTIA